MIVPLALAGCGQPRTPVSVVSSVPRSESADARAQLAARAAAAKDRHFVAGYSLSRSARRDRGVLVTVASDRTWRLDIQGGALGGSRDIALVGRPEGQYQCALTASPGNGGCVKIAAAGRRIPASVDPLVQYPFTSWLEVLTDPSVAVTVTVTTSLPEAPGTCFAIEPTTVTLAPPIQSSVACYADDGTLTGARAAFGTLVLAGSPTTAPETASLPGPVVSRAALPTAAPPPAPSPSRSGGESSKPSPPADG
ncbi:MAG: hypothetical protein KJO75_14865 [Dactylosporangium sp.]|nr:hypothetical protein [Dactylosporangium sp.]